MKRSSSLRFALSVLLTLAFSISSRAAPDTEDYSIDNYELTIESAERNAGVRVTIDITYLIRTGKKSAGFKYIGDLEVEQPSGRDGEGNTIKTWVEYQRETRLNWSFPPAGPGKKQVIISFTIPNAITNAVDSNEFSAEWAGFFRVPVNRAVYRFIFPDDVHRSVVVSPSEYSTREQTGRRTIEILQTPLKQATFEMTFSPRIVDSAVSTRSTTRNRSSGSSSWSSKIPIPIVVAVIAMLVGAFAFVARKAKRAGSHGGSSAWWSSGSSCAGGSSCSSSSCGSSCGGGGCGGGCGG